MSENSSYRQILRSSSIIGGASVINILVGLLRTKVAAVLLGPAGVGLIGLFTNLAGTASGLAGLGLSNSGTRQIADAVGRNNEAEIAAARRALFWGAMVLASLGALVFWSLRGVLAERVLGDTALSRDVGWLALAVALNVASASQGALLNGLRYIGDIARVSVWSGVLSTTLGTGALLMWGRDGLMAFVLSAPLASFVLGHLYVARVPKVHWAPTSLAALSSQWRVLVRFGAAFMVAGLTVSLGQLLVRTMVQRTLGIDALGDFQAAWMISMTYIGFVLQAMGTDYYPRLTAAIRDHATANRLVNEQTEVALLLAAPVFLMMLGLAPWIIELLYSHHFSGAVSVLRWQVLGDILKVASWPLGFIILAAGEGRLYMLTECLGIAAFVGLTWIGLPLIGIQATGVAFVGMYLIYLPVVWLVARRKTRFAWQRSVYTQLVLTIGLAMLVFLAALWSRWLGAGLGVFASLVMGVHGLARLGHMASLDGPVGRIAAISRRLMIRVGAWRD